MYLTTKFEIRAVITLSCYLTDLVKSSVQITALHKPVGRAARYRIP